MKKLQKFTVVAIVYCAFWWVTDAIGAPKLEDDVMDGFIARKPASPYIYEDLNARPDLSIQDLYPIYESESYSPAPFVLVSEHSWENGQFQGEGNRSVYIWAFGLRIHLFSKTTWVS